MQNAPIIEEIASDIVEYRGNLLNSSWNASKGTRGELHACTAGRKQVAARHNPARAGRDCHRAAPGDRGGIVLRGGWGFDDRDII